MNLDNLKPFICVLQQPPELLLGPLLRIQDYHHSNVQLTQSSLLKPRLLTPFGQYGIIDKERGSWFALLQCGQKRAQDLDTLLVGPVVHALANEEGADIVDGLGIEEVVLHVDDTGADFRC